MRIQRDEMARSSCPKQVLGFCASWVPIHFKGETKWEAPMHGVLKSSWKLCFSGRKIRALLPLPHDSL